MKCPHFSEKRLSFVMPIEVPIVYRHWDSIINQGFGCIYGRSFYRSNNYWFIGLKNHKEGQRKRFQKGNALGGLKERLTCGREPIHKQSGMKPLCGLHSRVMHHSLLLWASCCEESPQAIDAWLTSMSESEGFYHTLFTNEGLKNLMFILEYQHKLSIKRSKIVS